MKRKLIDFEVFKKIKEDSLSTAETELREAEDVLARSLGVDHLSLHCFGESDVTYETSQGAYVHATYRLANKSIILENIEELVIDEQSAKKDARKHLSAMVEDILGNNDKKAEDSFKKYFSVPSVRRGLMEGTGVDFWVEKPGSKTKKKRGPQSPSVIAKRVRAKKTSQAQVPDSEKKSAKVRRDNLKAQFGDNVRVHARFSKAPKKKIKEWANISENVIGYVDYHEFGPIMRESEMRHDEKGNVVAVRIPDAQARNEGKILTLNYKHMLDTEVKVLRGKVKSIHEETSFWHAMSDLRKTNALSDEAAMQNVLEAVIKKWPNLLYLTQPELAKSIAVALESAGETNWDDEICDFLANGILQTATEAYSERVARIARLSGGELDKDNVYESFQAIAGKFYTHIDEASSLEKQVFIDLYNTLVEVHDFAKAEGNEALRGETASFLKELYAVLAEETEPTVELAEEVATWLQHIVEANVPGAEETWNVSNTPHQTVNGDHPKMKWAADQTSAVASNHNGDWGDSAPVSDGKSYKGNSDEMRNNGFGNWSDDETWPSLKNPYTPKPFGDYTMKGEKGADKDGDNDWSRWQSNDTLPALQNPNVKDSPWDTNKYKMKSDNLVTDQ